MRFGLLVLLVCFFNGSAQISPIYENLPVGKYPVGLKIFTVRDDSRIAIPEYNYLGEKNKGDRHRKITVHLWYPAKIAATKKKLLYQDYCYNNLLSATNDAIDSSRKVRELTDRRRNVEAWFGKTTDAAWAKLLQEPMLAHADADALNAKFPLLVGMLRPLSTSIINEILASNGFIVAMVQQENSSSFALSTLEAIPDMRFLIAYLEKRNGINIDQIGTYGFSGSGFSQVLFAMKDYRIKAVADIESGIYMDGLFQDFSASNYYIPSKLRAPFLHIFSRDLSSQEKFINEFEIKTNFAKRYRLILNQPGLHHWDFASEGYTAAIFLDNRGEKKFNIRKTFEIASRYLLNFFNAELKKDTNAKIFLSAKPVLEQTHDSLWSISVLNPVKPAPDKNELEYIIRAKGVETAVSILKAALKVDSGSNIMQWYNLNSLGYTFLNEKKYNEAIAVFNLNIEFHPDDANLFDSLAEAFELSGDKENMKKNAVRVMDLLSKKSNPSNADKGLIGNAEKRLKE